MSLSLSLWAGITPLPTATPRPTRTATSDLTPTPSYTPTNTYTVTPTGTITQTGTATPTNTPVNVNVNNFSDNYLRADNGGGATANISFVGMGSGKQGVWTGTQLFDTNQNAFFTSTHPGIVDDIEAYSTITKLITTSSGGYYFNYVLTPTASAKLCVKGYAWETDATTASGILEIKFATSGNLLEHNFLTNNIFARNQSLHFEGSTNEPLAVSITSGGNAKDYFIIVVYKNE